MKWPNKFWLGCLLLVASVTAAPAAESPRPAEIEVSGTGWLQNRRLQRSIARLRADPNAPVIRANGVEDAVFFLFSALAEDGFLAPRMKVEMTRVDGSLLEHEFDAELTQLLPRPLQVSRVHFRIDRGVRSTFDEVRFVGDAGEMSTEDLEGLLLPTVSALSVSSDRAYSPAALKRGLGRIRDAFAQQGFAQAEVEATEVRHDAESGDTDVTVQVRPGPRWRVTAAEWTGPVPDTVELPSLQPKIGLPWTVIWEQDAMQEARHALFRAGYPDAQIRVSRTTGERAEGERPVRVVLWIEPGAQVRAGPVRFTGDHEVKESVLRRRVRVEEGDLLNPLRLEAARYRLARLGAFRRVALDYEPPEGDVRSPVFTLTELPPWEVHLLAGYGSYEQLRGGIEVRRNNVLHRAHQARMELIQSFKSTSGEITYTVPELFGEAVDGSVQLFGLEREELAFVRQEFGGTVSLRRRRLPWIEAEGAIGYTYQSLQNRENELVSSEVDTSDTIAASIELGLTQDRRDNPLVPRQGYRWFGQVEVASDRLGSQVEYQRLELGIAAHFGWGRSRWIHVGVTHGVVLTLGAENDRELPVNRRFYPGGDNSIRGYQLGEAAPRGPDGRFIGAKSTALINLELEQALVGKLTGVIFFDTLGIAAQLEDYPFDEYLYSLGLGLRYQTIIGPVRLEYGHNLNPRVGDPDGTLHFSLGFPF